MATVTLPTPWWLPPAQTWMVIIPAGEALTVTDGSGGTSSNHSAATIQQCLDGRGVAVTTADGGDGLSTTITIPCSTNTYVATLNVRWDRASGEQNLKVYNGTSRAAA